MEVTQEILLPVLLAAIVANTVILVLVVIVTRFGRRDRMTSTRSALEGSLMSTSFVNGSRGASWQSSVGSIAVAGPDDAPSGEGDPDEDGSESDAFEPGSPTEPVAEPVPALESDGIESGATAGVDALTGLLDQPAFLRAVAAEDVRIARYQRPATVAIFELGGLDRLVDRLGADAADRVVPALADTMRRLARDVDQVARLGQGRFGVLLPETDEIAAINYVDRVLRACELWLESGAIALTLAAGWAGTAGDPTLLAAQRLATDRMYVELRRETRLVADR